MATPITAATITPASTPWSAPTPMATIDSPRAMMMISPCRSAKCSGTSRQPSEPNTYGSATSRRRAVAHSAPCTQPSKNEAVDEQADAERRADGQAGDRATQLVVAVGCRARTGPSWANRSTA